MALHASRPEKSVKIYCGGSYQRWPVPLPSGLRKDLWDTNPHESDSGDVGGFSVLCVFLVTVHGCVAIIEAP